MQTISKQQREEMARKGLIDGESRTLKLPDRPRPKIVPAPASVPEVHNHKVENHNHMDLTPLAIEQKAIQKVIEKNSDLIKALSAQMKDAAVTGTGSMVFKVKRDSNGFIEEIVAERVKIK